MKLPRRAFLHLTAGAAALPVVSRIAWAQAYPARPVRLIVQVPAGGAPDIIARVMGEWLSERLGQQFVVDNRPGASGNVATEAVIRSPGDGYTLLLAMSANAINPSLYENLRFHFARDAAPVASIGRIPLALEINPSLPTKTIPDSSPMRRPIRARSMSRRPETARRCTSRRKCSRSRPRQPVHVAYRGEPVAVADVIAGQVQAIFGVLPSTLPYIRSGQLRALGVTTANRQEVLPDLPAIAEVLPGFEASGWYGVAAPKDTPPEIVDRLNRGQCRSDRSQDEEAPHRPRLPDRRRVARRLQQVHQRRNREMDQGGSHRRPQDAVRPTAFERAVMPGPRAGHPRIDLTHGAAAHHRYDRRAASRFDLGDSLEAMSLIERPVLSNSSIPGTPAARRHRIRQVASVAVPYQSPRFRRIGSTPMNGRYRVRLVRMMPAHCFDDGRLRRCWKKRRPGMRGCAKQSPEGFQARRRARSPYHAHSTLHRRERFGCGSRRSRSRQIDIRHCERCG